MGCYLLLSEDSYYKHQYIQKQKEEILTDGMEMMNLYETADLNLDNLEDALQTLPFMAEKKLVIVRSSGIFKGKEEEIEKLLKMLNNLPEYVELLFDEKEADKRGRLFKKFKNKDDKFKLMEFPFPGEIAVIELLEKRAQTSRISLSKNVITYFVRHMPQSMDYIFKEWEKIECFGKSKALQEKDIDDICVFSLDVQVFNLIKKITSKQAELSLEIYKVMMEQKESPYSVLSLIARQYRLMIQTKCLVEQGTSNSEIASRLKIPPFVVGEIKKEASKFTHYQLEKILDSCTQTDKDIKSGVSEAGKRVEFLILELL